MDHPVVDDRRHLVDLLAVGPHRRGADAELPARTDRTTRTADVEEHRGRVAPDAATPAGVLHAHRDHVAPRVQRTGRHVVQPRSAVIARAAHLDAVHPRDVVVVDGAEPEAQAASGLAGREVEADAVPHDAVEAVVALLLPEPGHRDGLPPALVERGVGPRGATVHESRVRRGDVADLRAQPLDEAPLRGLLLRPPRGPRGAVEAERGATHPRLDPAPAPRGVDDADRHVDGLSEVAREIVRDRAERADVLRIRDGPRAAGEIGLGRVRERDRHLEVADRPIVRGGDRRGGVQRVGERPLHVRLTRRDPDVSDEDVAQHDAVRPGAHDEPVRPPRSARRELDAPGSGLRCGRGADHAVERHGDRPSRRTPPPYRQG